MEGIDIEICLKRIRYQKNSHSVKNNHTSIYSIV